MSWINGWTTAKETPKAKPEELRAAFVAQSTSKKASSPPPAAPAAKIVGRPQNVTNTALTIREEQDAVLDDLQRIVAELHQQASGISHEVDYHNHVLDRLNTRVEDTTRRVRKDNDRIVRLT